MIEKIKIEINKLNRINRILVIATIIFLIYGYICRIADIFFFWESKTIGWILFFVSIIGLLIQRIKEKKESNKNFLSEKIFVAITIFILLIKGIIFIVTPWTNAYQTAREYLLTDKNISNEIGEVKSIFVVPIGGLSINSSSNVETGQADLNFIVKGKIKFKDINLQLEKEPETKWIITETK